MNVSDSPFVRDLMTSLGLSLYPEEHHNIAPGASAEIVIEQNNRRELQVAVWSLLIEPKENKPGYRPNPKWRTFNSKSTRLESSPLWSSAFKSRRAIIPASCFFEWKNKICHRIEPLEQGIAFAGLYRQWQFEGESVCSFSIITLPGQKAFSHIHEKSYPLMLKENEYDMWLDPAQQDTQAFQALLRSGIRADIRVTPVDSPAGMKSIGDTEIITAVAA